jgi:UDP-perosamine 4-acetyltransferase
MMTAAGNAATPPVIVLGAGGHAAVLIDALQRAGRAILGCVDPRRDSASAGPLGAPVLGSDDAIARYRADEIELVNGIGATDCRSAPGGWRRHEVDRRWRQRGYSFARVVHPSATIGNGCDIGDGIQIMAGVVVQTGTRLGAGCIVNTGARIDHDCTIGALAHIAPGAVLCGGVTVGDGAFVGAGATIVPGVAVGADARVGAGMVVIADVPAGARCSPADGSLVHTGLPGRLRRAPRRVTTTNP